MSNRKASDPQVLKLDDLERRVFWYGLVILLGLTAAALGASLLMAATSKSLDQVADLSERVERLTPATTQSEPSTT